MDRERNLLPWILGGLSAATIAVVAFAAVSAHRDAPMSAPTPAVAAQPAVRAPVSAPALPAPSTAQASVPASVLASVPDAVPAPAQAQAAVEPEVPAGQIWQCTTKGVKTFSNNPCGEKSTLLDVGPINTMSAMPAVHYVRASGSEPRYSQGYADQGATADEQYSDDYGAEGGANSYTVVQGARYVAHRRPEHAHRPPHHNPGRSPGPVRRY